MNNQQDFVLSENRTINFIYNDGDPHWSGVQAVKQLILLTGCTIMDAREALYDACDTDNIADTYIDREDLYVALQMIVAGKVCWKP